MNDLEKITETTETIELDEGRPSIVIHKNGTIIISPGDTGDLTIDTPKHGSVRVAVNEKANLKRGAIYNLVREKQLKKEAENAGVDLEETEEEPKGPFYVREELMAFGLTQGVVEFLLYLHNRSRICRPELGDSRRDIDMNKVTLETVRNILRSMYAVNVDRSLDEHHANEIKAQIRSAAIRHAKHYARTIGYDL